MAELPYCISRPEEGLICNCDKPYMMVTLKNAGLTISIDALIDSGCVITLVNAELAEPLGIDLDSLIVTEDIGGICGEVTGKKMSLEIYIKELDFTFLSPVVFIKDLPVPILLGQYNFFEAVDVHFQKSRHRFIIEKAGNGKGE